MITGQDIEELVPALHLLIGDRSTADRAALIRMAFPNEFLGKAAADQVIIQSTAMMELLEKARDIADGSSGLGVIAAQQVNELLKKAYHAAARIQAATIS